MRKLTLFFLFVLAALAANVTGTWKGTIETPNGSRESTITLKADGEKLTGSVSGRQGDTPIQEGKVSGDTLSFIVVRNFNGNEFKMQYHGKVSGDEIKFDISVGDRTMQMTAKRQ